MPSHRRLRASPLIPAIQQSHCPVLILVGARIKRLEKECDRDLSLAQSRAIPNHQCRHNSDTPISALQRSAMSIESDDVRLRTPAECHVRNWVRYPIPIELAVPRLLHRSRTTDLCRINLPVAIQQLQGGIADFSLTVRPPSQSAKSFNPCNLRFRQRFRQSPHPTTPYTPFLSPPLPLLPPFHPPSLPLFPSSRFLPLSLPTGH